MIHIGFTGTRNRNQIDPARLRALDAMLLKFGAADRVRFHHGDCLGMDAYAHEMAVGLSFRIEIHPPSDGKHRAHCDWHFSSPGLIVHPERPYLERNRAIVDACSVLIAVPRDPNKERLRSGTWATVRYARKIGQEVIIL